MKSALRGYCMALGLAALLLGCGKGETPTSPKAEAEIPATVQSKVVVINYPLLYMVQQIAGNMVDLHYPVPADRDPAFWQPDDDAIALMQQADLVLLNGAGHEPWLDTVTLDEDKVVDTSKGFADQHITVEGALVHSHGSDGEHAHGDVAFTVWLDPHLAALQAQAVSDALAKLLPEHAKDIESNLVVLKEQFTVLEATLDAFTAGYKDQPLFASHPVYQYLERRCKLNLEAVHLDPGTFPDADAWAELDALVLRHPAKWMLWEDEPTAETRTELEVRGIDILVISPCGNTPESGNFLKVMGDNFERLLRINAPVIL